MCDQLYGNPKAKRPAVFLRCAIDVSGALRQPAGTRDEWRRVRYDLFIKIGFDMAQNGWAAPVLSDGRVRVEEGVPSFYRHTAEECRRVAAGASNQIERDTLLQIAAHWDLLAGHTAALERPEASKDWRAH